jgi:hypothetical protein
MARKTASEKRLSGMLLWLVFAVLTAGVLAALAKSLGLGS